MKTKMMIKGSEEDYLVGWSLMGFTSTYPVVKKKTWYGWKTVWTGSPKSIFSVEKALPDFFVRWYSGAVECYENHKSSWSNFKNNKC